jgi:hypothetical protein
MSADLTPEESNVLKAAADTAQTSAALRAARADQVERPHAIMPAAEAFRDAEHRLGEAVQRLVASYEGNL